MAGFFLRRSSFLLPTSARRSSVASVRSFASSASASSFISKQTRSSLFVSTGVTAVAIALSSRLASRTTPTTNTRVHHSHTTATARANTPASCVVNHSNTGSTANHAAVNHAASFSSSSSSPSPASVPIFAFPCEKSALEVLYAQHAAPHCERAFAINDIGIVDRQFQRWTSQLPMVKPFYAVKCNPDPVLLKSLGAMGASFDCASGAEIAACLATGHVTNPQQQIIFANPIKNLRDLQYARKVGVTKMTFDNVDELYKIKQHHPEAELVLRLLPDDSGSLMRFGVKFGAPTANIPRILATVKELGLKLIGCSFHIGSGCFDANKYYGAIQLAHSVFQQAEAAGLPKLQLLDLGGGFPGNPVPHARTPAEGGHLTPAFEEFATVIRRGLRDFFPLESGVTVMAEPGRYMATAWSTLFTLIQGKREEPVAANAPKKFLYYINDGVYGSFNCIMFDHAHPVPVPATQFMSDKVSVIELEQQKLQQQQQIALHGTRRLSLQSLKRAPMAVSSMSVASSPTAVAERQQHIRATHSDASSTSAAASSASSPAVCYGTFFGPTCDSMDVVATDFPLTDELCVGDWLAFEQFGAYTSAASSTFNGMERPDHYYVRSARPSPNAHF